MAKVLDDLKKWYESFPATGDEVVAVVNRKVEPIAPSGKYVLYQDPVNAATLQALETGVIPAGLTDQQLEEVKAKINDESIWSQLSLPSAGELNKTGQSVEMQIEQAKAAFIGRKAMEAEMQRQIESAEAEEIGSSDIVKPGKGSMDVESSKSE
ncbi:MAG: hypothetical protein J1E16_04170 [Muribaculaceae bacterium]|nr:hypothetical protein [Muribaculaceae bacterium]